MSKDFSLSKGHKMEELLRAYFLRAGYYVVRGVPFEYKGFDVTDIDLWMYGRPSSVSREITIVDVKNKKTPQAIERIFWVHGLKLATKATGAVVATNDKRPEVKEFGRELGILVLDGSFLSKLGKTEEGFNQRLSDEDFFAGISKYSLGKLDGDWKGRITYCKALLSGGLSFNTCNEWLTHGKFFAEHAISNPSQREIALRCLYLICSFIAISTDFILRDLSFLDQAERNAALKEGFTYGSKGNAGLKRVIDVAVGLVESHAENGSATARQLRLGIERDLSALNTDILADFFSKNEVAKNLFTVAKDFENISMLKSLPPTSQLSLESRSVLLCLLDFWTIDRVLFTNAAVAA